MNLIIDALDSNDRLGLISFENNARILSDLSYMSDKEKIKQRDIVNKLIASGGTYFRQPIREFLNGIKNIIYLIMEEYNLYFFSLVEIH